MSCNNCKFLHLLKKRVGKNWELSSVCTAWPEIENDGYNSFAIVIDDPDHDECEMFTKRGEDKNEDDN